MSNKSEVVLEIKNLKKYFPGTKALDGAKLTLKKGKVTVLVGENGAGKSTLLKTIFGIHKRTAGEIIYDGEAVEFASPKDALLKGVSMVHQELQQVPTTQVVDNIWLGRFPKIGPFVNKQKTINDTQKIFSDLNIKGVKPTALISNLSISQRQMIEIAKAVSYNSKVIILDEPTSSLTEKEVAHLFKIINKLKQKGVAVLFVSHKMSEVFEIADYITVFRDGKYISSNPVEKCTVEQIIKDMVGRDMNSQFPQRFKHSDASEHILTLEHFQSPFSFLKDINLKVQKGEILGIAGLVGSGRTELVEMIFGLRKKDQNSKMIYKGQEIEIKNPKQAMKNGIAMITEERKINGIFAPLNIEFNTTIAQVDYYKWPWGLLNKKLMDIETNNQIKKLKTKVSSPKQLISDLSGGNQQKVLFSRWLLTKPDLFIMDDPTRGIDVGAKYSVYELIINLAKLGKSIIMISSEMEELQGVCNRIAVMSNGRIAGILNGKEASQEAIMTLAAKFY